MFIGPFRSSASRDSEIFKLQSYGPKSDLEAVFEERKTWMAVNVSL